MPNEYSQGDMDRLIGKQVNVTKKSASKGVGAFSLGIARVVSVNYEEWQITLRTLAGEEDDHLRLPVPITCPGAGKRGIMARMPEIGDVCIIGWINQESSGGTRIPVILAWTVPGWWVGHDWLPTQDFAPDEVDLDPANKARFEGIFERVRHKLRHMEPGNVLLTSSQGSDIVMNEGVEISSRRGNEIRLRDQDQALIFRSLQQFHAAGGTRFYGGMVQRDATFLPTQMVSDGRDWAGGRQVDGLLVPLKDSDFVETEDDGFLTPAEIFRRDNPSAPLGDGLRVDSYLDPYQFLRRGYFIDEDGFVIDPFLTQSDAVYGGKPMYRVSIDPSRQGNRQLNAAIGNVDGGRAFTELRWELAHTHDGRLPVTEQTDGFDADRLPRSLPDKIDAGGQSNSAFLEFVLGSVVGNEPYSPAGRAQYGLPLRPVIFSDSGAPEPRLESALGKDLGTHSATLFRLRPPTSNPGGPSFFTWTKDGRAMFSVGGPKSLPFSVEGTFSSGLRLQSGSQVNFESSRGFKLRAVNGDTESNYGFDLYAEQSAVRIYGGGNTNEGRSVAESPRTGDGEGDQPSVVIEGKGNVVLKSGRRLQISATQLDFGNSQRLGLKALSNVDIAAGDKVRVTSTTRDETSTGKATETYSGPTNALPTSGAFRSQTFVPGLGYIGGPVDDYLSVLGDRLETFLVGNHTTTMLVGNLTYQTGVGVWNAGAGLNRLAIDSVSGMNGVMANGNVTMTAASGTVQITGSVAVQIRSAGATTISGGAAGMAIGPAAGKIGPVVSGADLDPLTGIPLIALGMGSPGHNLIVPS